MLHMVHLLLCYIYRTISLIFNNIKRKQLFLSLIHKGIFKHFY